jgi:hypothetical protein
MFQFAQLRGTEDSSLIIESSRPLDAVRNAFVKTCKIPIRESYADDWNLQGASFHHRIELGEDHPVREVPGCSEDNYGV